MTIKRTIRPQLTADIATIGAVDTQLAIIATADISQQKQLEEERLKLQKLESVGVLDGGIAPDSLSKGSTFSLFLPAADAQAETKESPAVKAAGQKGRILVMDDEESVRFVVGRMVKLLGHTVECSEEGGEAVARFTQARDAGMPFDAVILDLTVKGGVGGEETCRLLRAIDPEIKVIVSSGYANNPILSAHQSHGFSAYLVKPYTIEALKETLNRVM